jgi:hypothetical protein
LYHPGNVDELTRQLRAACSGGDEVAQRVESAAKRAEQFSQEVVLPDLQRQIATLLR